MLAFGMSDTEVGIVSSIYMFSQMISAFLAGPVVDRMGRRKSTALFDFLSWSVPCLIWAISRNFWYFVVAALFNGLAKIPAVSWDCLLVEDAPKDSITYLYSLELIATNLSALFAPISSVLVSRLTLVPALRILYMNAFIVMTVKLLLLYRFSTETKVGRARQEATRGRPLGILLSGYRNAVHKIMASRGTVFSIIISIVVEITSMLGSTFWQIIVSRRIGVPDELLPVFPMARNIVSIILFFTVIWRIRQTNMKVPLYAGFLSSILGCVLLISVKSTDFWGYLILSVSIIFEELGGSMLFTLRESLVAINADPEERSNILAILQTIVMLVSVPFGYIGGFLSDIDRTLPFVLTIVLLLVGILATFLHYRRNPRTAESTGGMDS
jgi:Major Facilitator Superfamily.